MPSFSIAGATAQFQMTEEGFADKAGLLEELSATIIVPDPDTWGLLFSMVTPREFVSVRSSKAQDGTSTIVVDLGGGAGVAHLDVSDVGLDSHDALLVELDSEAPIGTPAPRVVKAVFLLIPGT